MSRIQPMFSRLRQQGRKALIPYITAGDPRPAQTVALMHALVAAGADLIELGVPFSDPMADGPVIQAACERALKQGTTLWRVLDMVKEFRRRDRQTPVVLMGYLNPIEARGLRSFARRAKASGVDGVLVVDLSAEEAGAFVPEFRACGLDCIFLVSPTSSKERIQAIVKVASGYLYYVSLKGVTGSASIDPIAVAGKVAEVRLHTELPVAVGFGVRDAVTAARVGAVADGVIVGSALVSEIGRHRGPVAGLVRKLGAKLRPMRTALDSSRRAPRP